MGNNNEEVDDLIKETLTKEEAKFYNDLDDQNMFEMISGLFQGKNKWYMYLMNLMTLIFFILFVYCSIKFFNTEETELKELITWAGGAITFMILVSMLKIFGWIQMEGNGLHRKLRRLELMLLFLKDK